MMQQRYNILLSLFPISFWDSVRIHQWYRSYSWSSEYIIMMDLMVMTNAVITYFAPWSNLEISGDSHALSRESWAPYWDCCEGKQFCELSTLWWFSQVAFLDSCVSWVGNYQNLFSPSNPDGLLFSSSFPLSQWLLSLHLIILSPRQWVDFDHHPKITRRYSSVSFSESKNTLWYWSPFSDASFSFPCIQVLRISIAAFSSDRGCVSVLLIELVFWK